MKIAIFGRHPVPQPGFMGVMSLFEAIYLSRQGHHVTLMLPFHDPEALHEFLRRHELTSLDALDRFHGDFMVVPIFNTLDLAERYDVVIYQSYDHNDYISFFPKLRQAATILTKNFPKFVPGIRLAMSEAVQATCKDYDLVACALREDVDELRGNPEFWERYGSKVVHVPRGADPNMLHPGRKLGGRPTVALEVPFSGDRRAAIDFYVEPLRMLRAELPNLRVLTLGDQPHPEIQSEHIPYGRFDEVYERLFNEAWLFLIMDYRLSSPHVQAPVQQLHPADWSARAIYEVQNIEAQMSGSVIIGHPSNTIPELLRVGASAFHFEDYGDAPRIAHLMKTVIFNFPTLSIHAREFALADFTWERCMARWATAMETVLERKKAATDIISG